MLDLLIKWSIRLSNARSRCQQLNYHWISLSFRDLPPLVLHWGSKLIHSAATSRISERIAVVLIVTYFEEFLGVLIATDGAGREVEAVVLQLLETDRIDGKIIAISFHTTVSNSGMINGACTIIGMSYNSLFGMSPPHSRGDTSRYV